VWDQRNDEWDTGARAWRSIRPDADWGLVLQDDAVPVPDLMRHVRAALESVPTETCVSLYMGRVRPREGAALKAAGAAERQGASWIRGAMLYWGPAVLVPGACIPGLLEWAEGRTEAYDRRIGKWFHDQAKPVLY